MLMELDARGIGNPAIGSARRNERGIIQAAPKFVNTE
jgi:hypothetical protein